MSELENKQNGSQETNGEGENIVQRLKPEVETLRKAGMPTKLAEDIVAELRRLSEQDKSSPSRRSTQ